MSKIRTVAIFLVALMLLLPIDAQAAKKKKKKQNVKQPNPNLVHYVGGYGILGYSNLLHNIDKSSALGGATGAVGFEYILQYKKHFNFAIGVEAMQFNSTTQMDPFRYQATFKYSDNITDPIDHDVDMLYVMQFDRYCEEHNKFSVNVPITLGGEFGRYYFMVGAKAMANLGGWYGVRSKLTTWAVDPQLIDQIEDMPTHNLTNGRVKHYGKKLDWAGMFSMLDIAGTAEFGVIMDEWMPGNWLTVGKGRKSKRVSYRLGLFADYGVGDINFYNAAYRATANNYDRNHPLLVFGSLDQMTYQRDVVTGKDTWVIPASLRDQIAPTSLIASNKGYTADGAVSALHSLVIGGKFAMLIDVTPQPKPVRRPPRPRPQPKPVRISPDPPFFYCVVSDGVTELPLDAKIQLYQLTGAGDTIYTAYSDSITGFVQNQMKNGLFGIHVSRNGYFDYNDTVFQINNDTLFVDLSPIIPDVPIILKNLYFDTNKAIIKNASTKSLEDMYNLLHDNPTINVEITGHTDNVGSDASNKKLSERRAKAVYEEMVKRGIDAKRMTYRGRGEREPIDTNDTPDGRANNRRVEFRIVK